MGVTCLLACPAKPARASLLLQVHRYIEDYLDDPDLSPTPIATAHGISVRTFHRAFAETGTTVARRIRDRRLNVCYRKLAEAGATETVTDVAFRWGFADVGNFSRIFKQASGVSPSSVLASSRRSEPVVPPS